ncbi:MAG: LacI family DNA-binding transcriptional regulator [Dehalococcoidia bacterium]
MANLAGVDISTASRALTGERKVAAETVKRVMDAVATLGYARNQAARNLRLSKTMTLGVIINLFDTPIYLGTLEGMGSTSHECGYELMITSARGVRSLSPLLVQRLFERRVDGLILWTLPNLGASLEPLISRDIPVLAIGVREKGSPRIPYLNATEERPIGDAMQQLALLGHRTIVYLQVPLQLSRQRLPALERATDRAGLHQIQQSLACNAPMSELCDLLRRRLAPPVNATAILTDHHLAQVTAALHLLDIPAPDDVSLIGFARSRWAQETWLPTATIQTDAVELGQIVAQMMADWLGGTRPPDMTKVHVAEWVPPGSVGPARTHRLFE